MKLKIFTGVFIAVLALALQGRIRAVSLPPCTATQTPSTTCMTGTSSTTGYPTCQDSICTGPTQDINYGPGSDFIVTSVYRVPWSCTWHQYNVDTNEGVCLRTWNARMIIGSTCQDYDISLACISGG